MYLFLWCPFSSLKLLIGFRLNALFSGGLKIFYGSIRVSSLHQKKTSTGAIWLQALISLKQADESVFRTNLYMQHLHSSFWFLASSKRWLSNKHTALLWARHFQMQLLLQTCQLFNSSTLFDILIPLPYLYWKWFVIITSKSITHFTEKTVCFICRYSSQRLMIYY